MKTFSLILQQATSLDQLDQVRSFVGVDASGSFGILPDHTSMMTVLSVGLAQFRILEQPWQYLAMPGAILHFHDNRLVLSTRHYLLDTDYERISTALQQQLLNEKAELATMKKSLRLMEEALLKRMWQVGELIGGG